MSAPASGAVHRRLVEELDLAAAGIARCRAEGDGPPGYSPADLLKLYIYGYLNRVRSAGGWRWGVPSQHRGDLAAAGL